MNLPEDPLRRDLAALPIPMPAPATKARAKAAALDALLSTPSAANTPTRTAATPASKAKTNPQPRWQLAAIGGTFATLAIAALLIFQHFNPAPAQPSDSLLTEMESMFPGQIVALVAENSEVTLDLASQPLTTPQDQRIRLTLHKQGQTLDVFTYSGNRVCLQLQGNSLCFTPLINGEGNVFLMTDQSVIPLSEEDSAAAHLGGYQLHARTLALTPHSKTSNS